MRAKIAAIGALAVLAGGCAHSKPSDLVEATFDCDGGARLSVTFDDRNAVAVVRTQAGGMHVLARTITGSGYGYEAERRSLRGKGNEAVWTDGGAPIACREQKG